MVCDCHSSPLVHAGNVEGDCHVTTDILFETSGLFTYLSLGFSMALIALLVLVSVLSHVYRSRRKQPSVPTQRERRPSFVDRLKIRASVTLGEGE